MFGQHSETLVLFAVNCPCKHERLPVQLSNCFHSCSQSFCCMFQVEADLWIWQWRHAYCLPVSMTMTPTDNSKAKIVSDPGFEWGRWPTKNKTWTEYCYRPVAIQWQSGARRGDTLQGCWRLMLIWASLKYWFSITWSGCRRRRSRTWFIWKFEFPRPHWCFSRSVWW